MILESKEMEEANKKEKNKIINFDDMLPFVGQAGLYQVMLFLLLLPFTFVYAFLYMTQFFLTLVPMDHWCNVPELEKWNLTQLEKMSLSIPLSNIDNTSTENTPIFSQCKMYNVNFTDVLLSGQTPNSTWPTKKCDNGWIFNYTNVPYASIAAELEWVCDKAYLSTTTQSAFFIGSIIGGFIFGYIGDHYGRVPALVICNAVGFFASLTTAFANSFWSFALIRAIVGLSFDNCFNFLFIITIEYVGPKYRTVVTNMSFGIYFAIAASLLPWIAYYVANWRILSIVTALPLVISFLAPWIVPESARWYLLAGKTDKAIDMLKKIERINGKTVDPAIYEEFKKCCNDSIEKDTKKNNYTVLDLFKLPRLRRITVTLLFYWISLVLVFDGHVWTMKLLHSDVFTSFSVAALTELPAAFTVTLLLDTFGRRWLGFSSMILGAVFSFIAIFTPKGLVTVAMAVIARFGVNVAGNIGFQFAAELLPTVVRAQGVSLIHLVGHIAHIIGPYVIYLADIMEELPLIYLGVASIVGAFLTLNLPETLDQDLPGTLQEGNDFGEEQSYWWMPCFASSRKEKSKYDKKIDVNAAAARY